MEFKFRHYDKRYKELRYSDRHDGEFYINTKGVLYMYAIPKSESGLETKYYKSYNVDMFSGRIDCNGVGIYKGDILKANLKKVTKHQTKDLYSIVEYIDCCFTAPTDCDDVLDYVSDVIEVIGNVYENNDLANEIKNNK